MADITFRSRALGSSILGGVALLSAAALVTPAFAQDAGGGAAANPQASSEVDEVVVTGSRIARKDYLANSPIVTVTQEDVKATGSANIET